MSIKTCHVYRSESGIGLIELMVSMLIGLFIMAGVLQMFGTTSQNAISSAGASRIQENLRYAFNRIAEDISQTGNLGCMSTSIASRYNKEGGSNIQNLLGVNSSPVSLNSAYDFLTVAHGTASGTVANTDIFRIRFVNHSFRIPVVTITPPNSFTLDTTDDNFLSLTANSIVGVTNCNNGAVFLLNALPTALGVTSVSASAPTAGLYNASSDLGLSASEATESQYYLYGGAKTGAYEYFIGGVGCPGTRETCALFRRASGNAPEELVQGVHDLDVFYGSTNDAGVLTFTDAANVTDWSVVDRLKVTMTFNSIENAQTSGNLISGSIDKTASRVFNLYNQL